MKMYASTSRGLAETPEDVGQLSQANRGVHQDGKEFSNM